MPQIGYAAMLEQFHPTELIGYCVAAEAAGFSGVMAADHVQPWVPAQGNAAFVWAFMAGAAEHTKGDIGPGVTCPSFRQHPAIIAQAAATMAAMYPGRFWLGLGSGEALNEHVVADYWPEAPERIARLFEAIEIMRKLFTGKDVKHKGEFYKMETMRIWTMPDEPPPIYVATAGPLTAEKTGRLCDGLITVGAPEGKIEGIFERFEKGAKEAGKDPVNDAARDPDPPFVGTDRRGSPGQCHGPMAKRRDEVPEAGRPFTARLRADGQARPTPRTSPGEC